MNNALMTITPAPAHVAQIGATSGAMERLSALIAELLGPAFAPTFPAHDGDAAIILDWLATGRKARSPKTQREYLRDICGPATGFLTFVDRKTLATVTRRDVQAFSEAIGSLTIPATVKREAHSLALSSQYRMMASVKGLFSHANGIGYISFNPAKGVTLPALPESKRNKAMSHGQSLRMLMTAQTRAEDTETAKRKGTRRRDYLLNKLCYLTGGRISEVLALKWEDVYSTDAGGECKITNGKGQKERVLSLPAELFRDLTVMRAERRGSDHDFVFISQKGGHLSVSQGWRIVTALAAAAKIERKVSPHTWRHSIATQLLDNGAPLHQVSEFLGHSDPKITVKAYYSASSALKVKDFINID
jgi:integrase/recombinase XerD